MAECMCQYIASATSNMMFTITAVVAYFALNPRRKLLSPTMRNHIMNPVASSNVNIVALYPKKDSQKTVMIMNDKTVVIGFCIIQFVNLVYHFARIGMT